MRRWGVLQTLARGSEVLGQALKAERQTPISRTRSVIAGMEGELMGDDGGQAARQLWSRRQA